MDNSIDIQFKQAESDCSRLFKKVKRLERELDEAKSDYLKASTKLKELKRAKVDHENKAKLEALNSEIDSQWIDREFQWTPKIKTLLKDTFGFDSFRPKQLAAINATLSKKDVLLVMPTGGGKSLVYQLPALVDKGLSLIVCPLISLIEDQLIALRKFGVNAATIHSNTSKEEVKNVYQQMSDKNSSLRLLYVTPEWLAKSKRFMANLKKCYEAKRIARVAIDEVHCCSSWGHDFRPDYGYLGLVRKMLANVPFLGLTATATMTVLTDVQTMLNLEDCMIITAPFNRPNLFYEVRVKPTGKDSNDYIETMLTEKYANQTGIIYATTITDCVNLATELRGKGLKVAPYHAQLEPDQKKDIHRKWIEKRYQAVVATVAFGMGIDNPDVRFVIHHTIPKSMESLYQESGRAGRDGKRADCTVFFSLNDHFRVLGMVSSLVDEKKASAVLEYCLDRTNCRRALLATHFEEVWDKSHCNEMCDICICKNNKELVYYDLAEACSHINDLIDQASSLEEKLTLNKLLDAWLQTGPKKLRHPLLDAPKIGRPQAEVAISFLLLKKYLAIDKSYNAYSTICYIIKGRNVGTEKIELLTSDRFPGFPKRYPAKRESDGQPAKKKTKTG